MQDRRNEAHAASSIAAILAGLLLSGCGSINSWLSEKTADNMPTWMGGLPEDAPPRPSDPRYPEYERAQQAKAAAVKSEPVKPEATK